MTAKLPPQRHQKVVRNVHFIPVLRSALLCEETWNACSNPSVELPSADPHCVLPDGASTACSSFRRSQIAGDAFMLGCENRFQVRRLPLASLMFCPLATHRQELSAQLWASLMRLTDVSSCSAHRSRDARVRNSRSIREWCGRADQAS